MSNRHFFRPCLGIFVFVCVLLITLVVGAKGNFAVIPSPTNETPGVSLSGTAGLTGTILAAKESPFAGGANSVGTPTTGIVRSMVVDPGGGFLDFYYQIVNTTSGGPNLGSDIFRYDILGFPPATVASVTFRTGSALATLNGSAPASWYSSQIGTTSSPPASADRDVAVTGNIGFDFPAQPPAAFGGSSGNVDAGQTSYWMVIRANVSTYAFTPISIVGGSGLVSDGGNDGTIATIKFHGYNIKIPIFLTQRFINGGASSVANGLPSRLSTAQAYGPVVPNATRITSATSVVASVGQSFTYQITATNNPVFYAATGLPAGLGINTNTGVISGTPTTPGVYTAQIGASQTSPAAPGPYLTLTIGLAPPTITSAATATAEYGHAFSYQITATGNPTGYNAAGLPAGLSVNTSTGLISGTTTTPGAYNVVVSATNTAGTGTANLTLTVLPQPPPVITSAATATATIQQAFTYQISATNSPSSYNATGLPAGLAINTSTGIVSGTPTVTGSFTITVSAANTGGTGTAALWLTVHLPPDSSGPVLSNWKYDGVNFTAGMTVTKSAAISVNASDSSGVSRVEFNSRLTSGGTDTLIGADTSGTGSYQAFWNADQTTVDGDYTITLKSYDTRGNVTVESRALHLALAAPPSPTITAPVSGSTINRQDAVVAGKSVAERLVALYVGGALQAQVTASADGSYNKTLTLADGINQVQAASKNRAGESLRASVAVTVDRSLPAPPSAVLASAQANGAVQLTWTRPSGSITGYNIYRSASSFDDITLATKLNTSPLTATNYTDAPSADGTYFYRLTSINAAATESVPSPLVSAKSDKISPTATSIEYVATGKYDAGTGRFGIGAVNVAVTISEPPAASPYFSITPLGGGPIVITLQKETDLHYTGSFLISSSTPSGLATATISMRDEVGNRGTSIGSGGTLLIDTAGPRVVNLAIQPNAPIKNNPASPQVVTFTAKLDAPVKAGTIPAFSYFLSNTAPTPNAVSSVTPGADNLTWIAVINLASTAGQTTENLILSYSATDDFDNVGTSIIPVRTFEVYQGNLPGLDSPLGLSAVSKPAGHIDLAWRSVEGAANYQLFRRAAGAGAFTPIALSAGQLALTDIPTTDGNYEYTVAAIRQVGADSSVGSQSNIASASSDRTPPSPPTTLQVQLVSQGVQGNWLPPAGLNETVTFSLYRSLADGTGAELAASVTNQLLAIDSSPSLTKPYYFVTTKDVIGNESAPSNRVYQNASLLPVKTLAVSQTDNSAPVVSWSPVSGNIAGYDLYQGTGNQRGKLNRLGLLTATSYSDTGYNAAVDRTYTVVVVDATHAESLGRSLTLPRISATLASDAVVNRGVMNRLNFAVKNDSTNLIENAQINVLLGGINHASAVFSIPANGSQTVPVVVGGYATLAGDTAPTVTTLSITPNAGESVTIVRNGQIKLGTSQIQVDVIPGEFLVGGNGTVKFRVANTSSEEIEITTASGQGSQPSPDVRFTILDQDGHVIATQPFKSVTGSEVVSLPNGQSVVRLPAGYEYLSPDTTVALPVGGSSNLIVRLEIDKIYFHQGQADEVVLDGVQTRAGINVTQSTYTAEVTTVTPAESNGDQDVVISGRAIARVGATAMPNAPVKLVIAKDGFERMEDLVTDGSGNFTFTFKPLPGEGGGLYQVRALHPDISDRTTQKSFLIRRVLISPTEGTLRTPRNAPQPVTVTASTGNGVTVNHLRIEYLAADQPGGTLPVGITVQPQPAIAQVLPNQSVSLVANISGTSGATQQGTVILRVSSDESNAGGWQKVTVHYVFGENSPLLRATPSFVNTGVNPGGSVTEAVRFENVGLAKAENLTVSLLNQNGTAAPAWAIFATDTENPDLLVGGSKDVNLTFEPAANTAEGDYFFKLRLQGANFPIYDVIVHVTVTAAGQGGVVFKVRDPFTGTLDGSGNVIQGVQGARIELQNEQVFSVQQTLSTDAFGEATASNLPAGSYKYRVNQDKHVTSTGRLWIRPGAVASQEIALQYNPVTVEWEVVPIVFQDSYNLVLNATFETNVPTPVVVMNPTAINIPRMCKGDVFNGEFTVANYGLIRADNLNIGVPESDDQFKVEMIAGAPASLSPGQVVKVAFRMTALKNFGGPCAEATAAAPLALGAAGAAPPPAQTPEPPCVRYSKQIPYYWTYVCSNGLTFHGVQMLPFYGKHGKCDPTDPPISWVTPGSGGGGGGGGGGGLGGGGSGGGTTGTWGTGTDPNPPKVTDNGGGGNPVPGYERPPQPPSDCYPFNLLFGSPNFNIESLREYLERVGCSVNLMNRRYEDDLVDMSVPIPGHREQSVTALRKFRDGKWQVFDKLEYIVETQVPGGTYKEVAWHDFHFFMGDDKGTLFRSGGVSVRVDYGSDLARARLTTRDNSWIVFDKSGNIRSAGRNGITYYTVEYDVAGNRTQVKAGAQVLLTYEWTDGKVTGVQDRAYASKFQAAI